MKNVSRKGREWIVDVKKKESLEAEKRIREHIRETPVLGNRDVLSDVISLTKIAVAVLVAVLGIALGAGRRGLRHLRVEDSFATKA